MNKKLKFWNCGASIDVTTNKFIEFEFIIDKDFSNYFEYTIKWSRKGDHAGFRYSIGLFKFFLNSILPIKDIGIGMKIVGLNLKKNLLILTQ